MSQAADSAMLREREAEEKLDAALSVHARQLSQRQVCYVFSGQCFRCLSNLFYCAEIYFRLEKVSSNVPSLT